MARAYDMTADPTKPAQHMLLAQDRSQLGGCLHAILKRYHECIRSNHRMYGFGRLRHLPGLDPNQDHVHHSHLLRVVGSLRRLNHEVTFEAVYPQAVLAYGLQMIASSNEDDLFSCLSKPPTEITPYSAGTKDRNTHQNLSTVYHPPQ
jgi:hypothetical protein